MEEGSQDLLGVTVNPEGMAHLKRLTNSTRWTFLGSIVLNLLYLLNSFVQRLSMTNFESWKRTNLPFYFELKLHFGYVLIASGLFVSEFYFFWLFSRRSAAACERLDSDHFNESLRSLNRFNRLAQLLIILSILFGVLEMWASFNFLAMRLHNSG
jgi:hypothetical protein